MATLPAQDLSVDLRAVTVRPTWGAQEHRRWDRLVAEHHYLPSIRFTASSAKACAMSRCTARPGSH